MLFSNSKAVTSLRLVTALHIFVFSVLAVFAQTGAKSELSGAGAPGTAGSGVASTCYVTGSGYSQTYVNRSNGDHYNCSGAKGTTAGTWTKNGTGGGGASGTGTVNTIPKVTNATGPVYGNSRLTDDGTDITINSGAGTTTIGDLTGDFNNTRIIVDDPNSMVEISRTLSFGSGSTHIDESGAVFGNGIITGSVTPPTAGGGSLGTQALPFSNVIIGNAANNSGTLLGTFTANREFTLPDATGTIQLVGTAGTGQFVSLPVNNTVLATATGTIFTSPGNAGTPLSATTEGTVSWPIVVSSSGKTIRNLSVRTGTTAKVNTPATVITIRVDGVDSAVTVTMTQTSGTTTSDITHSASLSAGVHLITVSLATTGTAAVSTSIAGISFEID